MKTKDTNKLAYSGASKILDILEELGYTSERKPSYQNELKDLVAIEIRRCLEQAAPSVEPELTDGFSTCGMGEIV